jgi:hypothetical protein
MEYFGYGMDDFIPSELSPNKRCVTVHHIDCRGMGGSKDKDNIENLMGLTMEEHIKYGDKIQWIEFLQHIHNEFMKNHGK